MSILEIKQQVQRLNQREREELAAFLVRLRHETPAWRRKAGRIADAVKAGRSTSADTLERRLQRA